MNFYENWSSCVSVSFIILNLHIYVSLIVNWLLTLLLEEKQSATSCLFFAAQLAGLLLDLSIIMISDGHPMNTLPQHFLSQKQENCCTNWGNLLSHLFPVFLKEWRESCWCCSKRRRWFFFLFNWTSKMPSESAAVFGVTLNVEMPCKVPPGRHSVTGRRFCPNVSAWRLGDETVL